MAYYVNAKLRRDIGARLRQLRVETGAGSQMDLAHEAGVHPTYVGRLERGESGVTVESLALVLAAMGVSLRDFFKDFAVPIRPRGPRKRGGTSKS